MRMKKYFIISGMIALALGMASCNKVRRSPGRTYMPDMAYSRAVETYSSKEELDKKGIHYTAKPVDGTMARGDDLPFPLAMDKPGDSANYVASKKIANPLPAGTVDMIEAERLYLIYCGICHGAKLDGNGPLFNGGDGPYPAAPRNFMDAVMKAMPEGQMFYSVTYGKNLMGSYASQLSTKQRWEVIAYIKSKQAEAANP
jgi:mono/diheme cytochrome c family protein